MTRLLLETAKNRACSADRGGDGQSLDPARKGATGGNVAANTGTGFCKRLGPVKILPVKGTWNYSE